MSFFSHVPLAPVDPILGLTIAFFNDERHDKVNLGVGLYRAEDLSTPVLKSVKMAEKALLQSEKSKEYLPIDGDSLFLEGMGRLVFGEALWRENGERIIAIQSVGGTSALHVGSSFLKEEMRDSGVYISDPTWPNHRGVFSACGFKVENYPYYNKEMHCADFDKMMAYFAALPEKSILVLHAACHNPTGKDLTIEQWKRLCELCKQKRLLPFFDCAYQGFGEGVNEDAWAMRHFVNEGLEICISVSCAKNFSIYAERVGCLFIVNQTAKIAAHVRSRVKQVVRTDYSNPPHHGAAVVAMILNSPELKHIWLQELEGMRLRISAMRQMLYETLSENSRHFAHMQHGKGMFGYTGLNVSQVERMRAEYGIYMASDGRINVCGLNRANCEKVARAMIEVMG